ncbi:MAG: M3 family oligoendopeptidase, partial [Pseudomonadota bacterium]|nr:M3 family oligoendopeptidase [Pseudomonadota bacterium]
MNLVFTIDPLASAHSGNIDGPSRHSEHCDTTGHFKDDTPMPLIKNRSCSFLCRSLIGLSFLASTAVFAKAVPERADIDAEFKWNLTDMYVDATAWEADRERFLEALPTLSAHRGKLGESGANLLKAIDSIQTVETVIANLYVYAGLKSYEDTRISENAARFSEAQEMYSQYQQALSYFTPELLAIPDETLTQFIAQTPGLEVYAHYLDETARMRPYTLSEAEERLLAMASDPLDKFDSVFTAIDSSDLSFGTMIDESGDEVELTNSRYGAFLHSTDRNVREAAWKGLFEGYKTLNHTLAANYEGHVKSRVFFARARGFKSRLEHATYTNAIPIEVFNNLITAAREGSVPLQRYLKLREKTLGVDRLEIWDMYAPIVPPTIKDVSFDEAKEIVAEALTPLGEEYINVYWKGFDEGWVDAMANRGKRGGAYSWGTYTSKPYLSMNFEGTLNNVSTLAHEYGHSIHSYLTRNTQPQVYGDYRTFIAEIASMTNEAILMQKMLSEANSASERAYLLSSYLDEFRGGFYRQASFADFEARAHAKVE